MSDNDSNVMSVLSGPSAAMFGPSATMPSGDSPDVIMSDYDDPHFTFSDDYGLSKSVSDVDKDLGSEDSEDSESDSDSDLLKFPHAISDAGECENSDSHSETSDKSEEDTPPVGLEKEVHVKLPASLLSLREKLLGGYTPPANPPSDYIKPTLTESQTLSLKHYVAWKTSNGTVNAYQKHASVLEDATGVPILSLYSSRKLIKNVTGFKALQVDICPNSCIAYTGEFEEMTTCPHVLKDHKICGLPRYHLKKRASSKNKPQAQMMYLPVMATIKAMFANADTSQLMRHRDRCLQQALHVTAAASRSYSDFGDSQVHMHHYNNMGLFQDSRDVALAISTDGAQLTMKKQSDTWLVILILLNLPPEIRYKFGNIIIAFSTPGPHPPGHIESFFWLLFQEMAKASEGIWTWDAVDSAYFLNKAYICMALGDMLGSAKMSGMAGHSAIYGDRFSLVKGARSSLKKGSKAQYYPLSPPENARYNPDRPSYDLDALPMRQEDHYWATIEKLEMASSKNTQKAITKSTGISYLPLCAASLAFVHPTFFPLDPFHLLYENNTAFIWDVWTTQSSSEDKVHLSVVKAKKFGALVSEAMSTLPPSFCGPVRDIFLKRHSQYKIYEWMALAHWYTIPIGIELEFDAGVLQNHSKFVEVIEFAMTIKARSAAELLEFHNLLKQFLLGYEKLYIGGDPEKILRARLCVFQLAHLPRHIEWNGSIRLGSQATVERAIGTMGHKIRSKKAPFANLANNIYEKELIKLLLLQWPSLDPHSDKKVPGGAKFVKKIRITKKERQPGQSLYHYLEVLCLWLKRTFAPDLEVERYGKFSLPIGHVLSSRLSEGQGKQPTRSSRHFVAKNTAGEVVFGEALAFFEVVQPSQKLVVYHPIVQVQQILGVLRGEFSKQVEVLPVTSLHDLVGIWSYNGKRVYILRKHPALDMLTEEEKGSVCYIDDDDGDGEDDENDN
jgi:hypothetical protein